MPEPHLRAADTDRAAVATALGEHMAAGRLTVDEYDERLARAYAAKTYGELAELTADLPTSKRHVPAPRSAGAQPAPMCAPGADPQSSWRAWLTTSLIVTTIWLITSLASWELNYFWPIWVIGPWGAVLLAQTIAGGKSGNGRQRRIGT
jgi:hypothetical protein